MSRSKVTKLSAILAVVAVFVFGASAVAAPIVLTQWDFEGLTTPPDLSNSAVGPPVLASTGVGTATGVHASTNTDWTTPAGNGSTNAYSSNEWAIGDYYQFQTSTLGQGGVQLSWAQARSGTGPVDWELRWSTDGATFTPAMSYSLGTGFFSSSEFKPELVFTADLRSETALNNQAAVYFRLVPTSGPSSTGGTARVDDFTVLVPEPASIALLLLASAGIAGFCRRNGH